MKSTKPFSVGVVIVVFHPDARAFDEKLKHLGTAVSIAVVDNTPNQTVSISRENVTYVPLFDNTGIANAQNEGIRCLEKRGCTHIVFFDQDSDFTEEFVGRMIEEYKRIEQTHENLFLLGPRVINKTNGEEYLSVVHRDVASDSGFVRRREIISSGSCVSVEKLRLVGVMDASLFIDFVDFEHCWRANAKGYVCGITENVTLPHKVGCRELCFPHGYRVIISAPFRYYYQYRNWLWLCRRRYVPLQWKMSKGVKFFLRLFYFPFCVDWWREIERNMFKGIKDGLFTGKEPLK